MARRGRPQKLKHVSASSIQLFQRCNRRWYYTYLLGIRGKTTDAMTRGSKVHEQLEKYLKDGTKPNENTTAGLIASKGLDLIPKPDKKNKVELSLAEFPVPNLPIPFKGFIDYLVTDAEDGIIEIGDHKTTSGWKWAKNEEELATNTQLIIYARHVLEHHPNATEVKLTHVYYLTRPPHGSKKVTALVSRQHVMDEFDKILVTVREMVAAAQETLDHTERNNKDCFAYGKRCSQYDECWHTITHTELLPMSNKQEDVLAYLRGGGDKEEPKAEAPAEVQTTEVINEAVTVYVGCKPVYGETIPLLDAIKPLVDQVREEKNVEHIAFVPYGAGYDILASKLLAQGLPNGAYYMTLQGTTATKLLDTVIQVANQVVIAG